MMTRHIAIPCGAVNIHLEKLKGCPGVEVYRIDGPDAENQVEMALLNDLVTPLKLACVGSEDGRRFAEMYNGTWVEEGPSAVADVLRHWGIQEPDAPR
jgi:hypothetical protein